MMLQPYAQARIIDDLLAMANAAPPTMCGGQLPLQAVSSRDRLEGLDSVQALGERAWPTEMREMRKHVRFDEGMTAEEGGTETESVGSTWGDTHSTAHSADDRSVLAPRPQ
jgi:hypothetical protein